MTLKEDLDRISQEATHKAWFHINGLKGTGEDLPLDVVIRAALTDAALCIATHIAPRAISTAMWIREQVKEAKT